ncbi:MAG: NADP-dependent oxidoreductase [Pseudomonadota bacterium]|jgi:Putative NADP-dependent oxidoreductases|nr:MAG: hypothetical protein DIU56_04690 [Pseudomonadota bacterium]
MGNVQVRITRPLGEKVSPEDFELVENEVPTLANGLIVCRVRWLALDPHARTRASPGRIAPARGLCEVIESRHDVIGVGDCVEIDCGLQQMCASDGSGVHRLHPGQNPASTAVGILGLPGMTAYFALLDAAHLQQGETVLISDAAGAIGSVAGQIARITGARPIGLAASRSARDWAQRNAGFAHCIDLESEDASRRLGELAPRGVDVFLHAGGPDTLQTLVSGHHLAPGARVVYAAPSAETPRTDGLRVVHVRGTDFERRREEFLHVAIAWYGDGLLVNREDIVQGLEQAPAHYCRLLRGEIFGQPLVKL